MPSGFCAAAILDHGTAFSGWVHPIGVIARLDHSIRSKSAD
jgi:hypothetical protein